MERGRVLIINMYNEGTQQQGIKWSIIAMRRREHAGRVNHDGLHIGHMLWLGDFNLHHPMWDKGRNMHLFTRENLDRSQPLINTIAEFDIQMALPKDVPMLCTLASGNYTRPDNIFISSSLMDATIYCQTLPEDHLARSDHIPVITHLNVGFVTQTEPPWPNFKAADWKEFRKVLSARLEGLEAQDSIPN